MCSPLIYCCFLYINEILAIIKSSLNSGNFGATELSGIQGLYGQNVLPILKKQQEDINAFLNTVDQKMLREMLISLTNEVVTPFDLEEINDHQLNVLFNFYNANWEFMIDKMLVDDNLDYITIVNE